MGKLLQNCWLSYLGQLTKFTPLTVVGPARLMPFRNVGNFGVMTTQCPLLAQSGHPGATNQCPLLGAKRTSQDAQERARQRLTA
jgi:hypothetical protein